MFKEVALWVTVTCRFTFLKSFVQWRTIMDNTLRIYTQEKQTVGKNRKGNPELECVRPQLLFQ